jgi:ankyrin repeat protein
MLMKFQLLFKMLILKINRGKHELKLYPFHLAVLMGRIDCLEICFNKLKDNLSLNILNFGNVLHLAVMSDQPDVITLFVSKIE